MKTNNIAIILIIGALLVGAYIVLNPENKNNSGTLSSNKTVKDTKAVNSQTIKNSKPDSKTSKEVLKANYLEYSTENLKKANESGRTLLFFHANWCPTCRAAEKDIMKNVADLPEDLTILKTNYDTETALKEKYNISYQHTFVQVDSDGNEITKWSGGGVKTILQNLEEVTL